MASYGGRIVFRPAFDARPLQQTEVKKLVYMHGVALHCTKTECSMHVLKGRVSVHDNPLPMAES